MVYRPPKHKPAVGARPNHPSSDPIGGPVGHADDPEAGLPGDDRNLVTVDENYASGDLEDRLWLFWQKHSKNVLSIVLAAFVGLILWQSWNLYQGHVLNNLQTEYQAINDASGFTTFAQAHPDSTLGKLAILEGADAYYKTGKFKDAADAYGKAATIWGIDEKGQRARLGAGLSLAQSGDIASAQQRLQSLYEDSAVLASYRAEAAFYNAVIFAQNNDAASAAKWIDNVNTFNSDRASGIWISEAKILADAIPAIKDTKALSVGNASALPTTIDLKAKPAASPSASAPAAVVRAVATSTPAAPKPAPSTAPATTSTTTGFDMSKLNGGTSAK